MLFQELFYGPYFCQVQDPQYYSYTEQDPRRPDDEADAGPRQADGHGPRRADVRGGRDGAGIYYNTAAVIDADGKYLGKYRKTHIPHVKGFWEKFYFRPGQPGLPRLRDRGGQGRRLHLLRPPLPGGRASPGAERCRDGLHPERHVTRPVRVPVARRAGQPRRRERLLRRDDQPGRHRGGDRRRRLLRPELLLRPARPVHRRRRQPHDEELHGARHGPRRDQPGPPDLAVLPGPRPDAYGDLVAPDAARRAYPAGHAVRVHAQARALVDRTVDARPAGRRPPASTTAGSSTRTSCGATPIPC